MATLPVETGNTVKQISRERLTERSDTELINNSEATPSINDQYYTHYQFSALLCFRTCSERFSICLAGSKYHIFLIPTRSMSKSYW